MYTGKNWDGTQYGPFDVGIYECCDTYFPNDAIYSITATAGTNRICNVTIFAAGGYDQDWDRYYINATKTRNFNYASIPDEYVDLQSTWYVVWTSSYSQLSAMYIYAEIDTNAPSTIPSNIPSMEPSNIPTFIPTIDPTNQPSDEPTNEPTTEPSDQPTKGPTREPTDEPTREPTDEPTDLPTKEPTDEPSEQPTKSPIDIPTYQPTTAIPTLNPVTDEPTQNPVDTGKSNGGGNNASSNGIDGNTYRLIVIIILIFICIFFGCISCAAVYCAFDRYKKRKEQSIKIEKYSERQNEVKSGNLATNEIMVTNAGLMGTNALMSTLNKVQSNSILSLSQSGENGIVSNNDNGNIELVQQPGNEKFDKNSKGDNASLFSQNVGDGLIAQEFEVNNMLIEMALENKIENPKQIHTGSIDSEPDYVDDNDNNNNENNNNNKNDVNVDVLENIGDNDIVNDIPAAFVTPGNDHGDVEGN